MDKIKEFRNEEYPDFVFVSLITNGRVETLTAKLIEENEEYYVANLLADSLYNDIYRIGCEVKLELIDNYLLITDLLDSPIE